mgnify:CR=1 FL=1
MARYACDEDGWRSDAHYDRALEELEAIALEDYSVEVNAILATLRESEDDDVWERVAPRIVDLADLMTRMSDIPFSSIETAINLTFMIERIL